MKCDALVVGGGITGSLVAERLTRQGLDVVLIDREFPGRGSTAASTSMLLWEIDRSLTDLTEAYGFERESRAYLASLSAVSGLRSLVLELELSCDMREKHSLSANAPACPANSWTMRGSSISSGLAAQAPLCRRGRRMPTRCNWRADCLELRLLAALAYSRQKPLNLIPRRARSASS